MESLRRRETRRNFLKDLLGLGVATAGTSLARLSGMGGGPVIQGVSTVSGSFSKDVRKSLAGGDFLGIIPFQGEGRFAVGNLVGSGLDARLALDLSTLTEDTLATPNDKFFIRTGYPDKLAAGEPWKISARGLVQKPKTLLLEKLLTETRPQGTFLAECSGNTAYRSFGLISAAEWSGIPLADILQRLKIRPGATRILISGFDGHSEKSGNSLPGASWIFPLEKILAGKAFLATRMNGVSLPPNHGYPVRLVLPGWYGCTWIKWVNEIALLDDRAPPTSQMKEFSGRTQQSGLLKRAKDFKPAMIDPAAMPVRVEKWIHGGEIYYRVIGILWGGEEPVHSLTIQYYPESMDVPVQFPPDGPGYTWKLWSHIWKPLHPGPYDIHLKINDQGMQTRRLHSGYYRRSIAITEI